MFSDDYDIYALSQAANVDEHAMLKGIKIIFLSPDHPRARLEGPLRPILPRAAKNLKADPECLIFPNVTSNGPSCRCLTHTK